VAYTDPDAGNGLATPWQFCEVEEIHFLEFRYNGPGEAGLAFDNFTPASLPADLSIAKSGTARPSAIGDTLSYQVTVTNNGAGDAKVDGRPILGRKAFLHQ
jgi:hypothetical protein